PLALGRVHHGSISSMILDSSLRARATMWTYLVEDVDIFDRAVRHRQAIFELKIRPVMRRALKGLFHEGRVFRMNTMQHAVHGRFRRSVERRLATAFAL